MAKKKRRNDGQNLRIGNIGDRNVLVQAKGDVRVYGSSQGGPAALKIIDVSAAKLSQTVACLDVRMINSGPGVAFTKELNVKVRKLRYYLPVVEPSGKYDLEITNDKKNALKISHKIMPNDIDRITINVSFAEEYWYWGLLLTVEIAYNEDQVTVSEPIPVRVF